MRVRVEGHRGRQSSGHGEHSDMHVVREAQGDKVHNALALGGGHAARIPLGYFDFRFFHHKVENVGREWHVEEPQPEVGLWEVSSVVAHSSSADWAVLSCISPRTVTFWSPRMGQPGMNTLRDTLTLLSRVKEHITCTKMDPTVLCSSSSPTCHCLKQ